MKTIIMKPFFAIFVTCILALTGCNENKFDFLYVEPDASFVVDKDVVNVGEAIKVSFIGKGQKITIFKGDQGAQFGVSNNQGISLEGENEISFSYGAGGKYTITLVATGFKDGGSDLKTVTVQKEITVKDDGSLKVLYIKFDDIGSYTVSKDLELNIVSQKVTHQIEIRPEEGQTDITIPVLKYSNYTNTDGRLESRSQVKFLPRVVTNSANYVLLANSDTLVNGKSIVKHVDASDEYTPVTYSIKTSTSSQISYRLCAVEIPQFSTYRIGTKTLTPVFDIQDVNRFKIFIPKANAPDSLAVVPTFTISEGVDVKYCESDDNGQPTNNWVNIATGENIRLINDIGWYKMTVSHPLFSEFSTTSIVKVKRI